MLRASPSINLMVICFLPRRIVTLMESPAWCLSMMALMS